MIGSLYTEITRDAWTTVPGRSKEYTYDTKGNCTSIICKEGTVVVFTLYLTYNDDNKCIKIECQ